MIATHHHTGLADHTVVIGRGIAARIRAVGRWLSGRIHAAADERARALGWEVTQTPGPFGLTSRSYHDPRFAARRQARHDTAPERDGRHD